MPRSLTIFAIILAMVAVLLLIWFARGYEDIRVGEASWYSEESCLREFGKNWDGRMANGQKFIDSEYSCASWAYPFATILLVRNKENGKRVKVTVTDRGPAKRLVKKGRIIDLTAKAFSELAPLRVGIIQVSVQQIK